MRPIHLPLFLTLLFGAVTQPSSAQAVSDDNEDGVNKISEWARHGDYMPGQVLVKFKDGQTVQARSTGRRFASTNINRLTNVLQKYGTEEMEQLVPRKAGTTFKARRVKAPNGGTIVEHDLSLLYNVKLDEEHAPQMQQLIDELKEMDEVEYAVIAIIDTGVDITHPDLADNIWTNLAEAEGEANYDNDGNGFKGDIHGWDFINNTPNMRDFNKHGTHVAGIAAASNNVIGIIQKILHPESDARTMAEGTAIYTIEDGTLYVESDVELAGVQVQLSLNEESRMKNEEFATAQDLKGFEHTSAWLSDNDYLFLAFNLNGRTFSAGKHALLHIGEAQVNTLRLSDAAGHNVRVARNETTAIDRMGRDVMTVRGVYDLQGRKLGLDGMPLGKGIYIVNGQKVVK